jgi:hypothetical protein
MTPADFLAALERPLQLHAVAFTRADLIAFVESAWPLMVDNPAVTYWCGQFRARLAMAPAGE